MPPRTLGDSLLNRYLSFGRRLSSLIAGETRGIVLFLALSILAALTEGFGVSLVVPILETGTAPGMLANAPLLGDVAALFAGMDPRRKIQVVALTLLAVVIARGLLQYGVEILSATIPLRLQRRFSLRAYAAVLGVRMEYIHRTSDGVLQNGIANWTQRSTQLLVNVALILVNLFILCVYVALMLAVSWTMTAMAVAFVVVMTVLLKQFSSGPLRRAGRRVNEAQVTFSHVVLETLNGMKLIRLSTGEQAMTERFTTSLDDSLSAQRRLTLIAAMTSPILTACAGVFIAALLFAAAAMAGEGQDWIGGILLFLFLLMRLLQPVSQINTARNRIIGDLYALEQLEGFYAETEAIPQPTGSLPVAPLSQGVTFDDVRFAYGDDAEPVIKGVSLTIPRGRMVAVVGPSGAGKSTMVGLLARLHEPQGGRILVDGVDLRDLDIVQWRRRISVVAQDVFIFNDTVAANLRFARDGLTDEQLRRAARLAAADEFIEKLPQGYDTQLGDRGVRLSGGQQQRLAIARAILAEPELLILDEATSHLDTFTERAIQQAVEELSRDRTVLVIAHRLSTIRRADTVVVMQNGRVAEQGRHEELMAAGGLYRDMIEHQRLDLVDDGDAPPLQA